MAQKIKMAIYGEPGVGKSTFAFGAPKPFFITTDGNYEYLIDYFGADPKDHKQVYSWAEFVKTVNTTDFKSYETIVIDLVEDLYMWAEQEFCRANNITHISDLGYGKGYGMLGNDFFIEFQKILALPKNIILILHGDSTTEKDRRGVEFTKYAPVNYLRAKTRDQIEGRVRFFVRTFATTEEDNDGQLITKRYLSLSPDGTTEYGITRGLIGDVPRYIPLDWDTFYAIASRKPNINQIARERIIEPDEPVKVEKPAAPETNTKTKVVKQLVIKEKTPVEEKTETSANPKLDGIKAKLAAVKAKDKEAAVEPVVEQFSEDLVSELVVDKVVEPATEQFTEDLVGKLVAEPVVKPIVETSTTEELTNEEKLAAIKAKMAALKANK